MPNSKKMQIFQAQHSRGVCISDILNSMAMKLPSERLDLNTALTSGRPNSSAEVLTSARPNSSMRRFTVEEIFSPKPNSLVEMPTSGRRNSERMPSLRRLNSNGALFSLRPYSKVALSFKKARFKWSALFQNTQFSGCVCFQNARFKRKADFTSPGNKKDIDALQGKVDFSSAEFLGEVSFNNRKFWQINQLQKLHLPQSAPFSRLPPSPGNGFHGRQVLGHGLARIGQLAYRTLKLYMEEKRARQEQLKFYALEMESRRREKKEEGEKKEQERQEEKKSIEFSFPPYMN